MARTHYIAGNWKMNTSKAEAVALAKDLVEQLKGKITFDHWCFGHYHINRNLDNKFTCLFEDFKEVK